MALLKVLVCVLLVTVAVNCAEDDDSGQYSPEKYEKPYETEEGSSSPAPGEEPSETPEPVESSEGAESPEPVDEVEESDPSAPAIAPLPEVTAADPVVKKTLLAVPYPLLYNSISAPVIYSDPQVFRFAGTFPVVVV